MSSSSSACDIDEFFSYHPLRSYQLSTNQEPWYNYYQTMGHPLIYYAEVQPSSRRSRSGVGKDPNFFVKAFRWYTQEHHPSHLDREKVETTPDFSGFANWLDTKYGQYIQEGQKKNINQLSEPEQRKPKKLLATMKSHFTRRHKTKNDGAHQKKSCNSCEYIMEPKEMSLTASDCRRSNIKAVCSDTQEKKCAMKSVSMNSIRYDVDYHKSIEIMVTEGDANGNAKDNCSCAKTEILAICESKPNNVLVKDVSIGPFPCDPQNVDTICECKVPGKEDAYTQYDKNMGVPMPPVPSAPSVPLKGKVDKITSKPSKINQSTTSIAKKSLNPRKPPTSDVSCLCSLERVPPTTQPTWKPPETSDVSCLVSLERVPPTTQPTRKPPKTSDVSCLVSLERVPPTTQPTRKPPKTSDVSCLCSLERVPPTIQPTKLAKSCECNCTVSFQNVVKTFHQQPPPTTSVTPVVPVLPPAPVVAAAQMGCLCNIRVNEAMQTSDTSIRLDDEVTKYPFFMKIVRADKLITDC